MNFKTKKCRWNTYTVQLSWVLIGLTTFSSLHAEAQTIAPTFSDVAYGPKEQQVLDFWKADSQMPTPLIMDIHGGGWRHGPKEPSGRDQYFLDRGISVAHITYRFTPANQLPVPVMDAARALQFLRSKAAEWNIDPERVIVTGHSAGGCDALWLATHDNLANPHSSDPVERQSTRILGTAVASAQTTIEPGSVRDWVGEKALGHPMICNAGGFLSNEDLFKAISKKMKVAQLYREFSAVNHLSPDDPPMMLEYGKLAADRQGDIHDGAFGIKFKERVGALGIKECYLMISDHKGEYPGSSGGKKAFVDKLFN